MSRRLLRAVGAGLALAAAGIAAPALAQAPAAATMQSRDLSGIWQLNNNTGKGNPQSEWVAGTLPYTPEGLKVFQATKPGKGPRMIPPAQGNDPIGHANPFGLYRTLIYPRPFQFVQTGSEVIQAFELSRVWRAIYTDGRPVPKEVVEGPFWYGYSVGGWEGDTLVVHTLAVDERSWMDEWGTPFSSAARFEERWRRTAPDELQMTLTVTDPTYYTKPWTSAALVYRRQKKGVEPQEIIFAPMDEEAFNQDIRDPAGTPTK